MTPQTQWITPVPKGALSRDRVTDDDPLGPDQDLFDHAPQYFLTILDRRSLGRIAQPGEEPLKILSQLEVGLAVEKLRVQRCERAAQARFLRSQVRHPGTQARASTIPRTIHSAVEAGISSPVGMRWFRQAGGMPPITLAPVSGRYLSLAEPEEIPILHARHVGVCEMTW